MTILDTPNPFPPQLFGVPFLYGVPHKDPLETDLYWSIDGITGLSGTQFAPVGPQSISLSSTFVTERVFGATVGLVTVTDPVIPSGNFVVVPDDPRFEVVSGVLKLKDSEEVFFADGQFISIQLTATSGSTVIVQAFTLTVILVPINPTDILLDNTTLLEQSFGAVVGNVTVTDPLLPGTIETITVTNDARFTVAPTGNATGILELIPSQQVIFAGEPTVALTLRAMNTSGGLLDKNFVITVIALPPPPQPPSSLGLDNLTVQAGQLGAVVGTLTATDPNLPPSVQTMTVTNDARFQVTMTGDLTGTLALTPGSSLPNTPSTVTVNVRSTNAFALFIEHAFVLTVIPVSPPTGPQHSSAFSNGFA